MFSKDGDGSGRTKARKKHGPIRATKSWTPFFGKKTRFNPTYEPKPHLGLFLKKNSSTAWRETKWDLHGPEPSRPKDSARSAPRPS